MLLQKNNSCSGRLEKQHSLQEEATGKRSDTSAGQLISTKFPCSEAEEGLTEPSRNALQQNIPTHFLETQKRCEWGHHHFNVNADFIVWVLWNFLLLSSCFSLPWGSVPHQAT